MQEMAIETAHFKLKNFMVEMGGHNYEFLL